MFLLSRTSHYKRLFACSRFFYSKPAWIFPTLGCVESQKLRPVSHPVPGDDSPCLSQRELLVSVVGQTFSNLPLLAAHFDGAPFPWLDSRNAPEHRTNTWAIPNVAVKHARAFFALYPHAAEYKYELHLKPVSKRDRISIEGVAYWVSVHFVRNKSGLILAQQELACSSRNFPEGPRGQVASFHVNFQALWESPEGGTYLSDEELAVVAERISEKGLDLLEPLEAALLRTNNDLKRREGFRPNEAVESSYDLLEQYLVQQQPWRPCAVKHHIIDGIWRKHMLFTPAHHLGKQYVGSSVSHRAIIALGSNVGDRMANIEQSLQAMQQQGINVRSTSFLYETEAMYYEDQDRFLNGVCEIETTLKPLALLDVLQRIETELGRVKIIDKGPRSIDLDILLYDFENVQHTRLQIPHKLMLEREFVLRPLADIISGERLPPPHSKQSILGYLEELEIGRAGAIPSVVSNLGPNLAFGRPNDPSRETSVMAILNVTPDSFSDGGKRDAGQLDVIEAEVRQFIADGATMIDIGGQSTRPGATRLPWQEELERVRPVIERIRSIPEAQKVAISVDTFYAEVARGAVAAGADIINDVSGGMLDLQMLPVIADLQVTVVLMHMRGTPETMNDMTDYPEGVVIGVAKELLERLKDAERAAIPRWRIILDPGLGFAKTQAQNLELLRDLKLLRNYPGLHNYPWLVGTSRKGFIGKITRVSMAAERGWGTAATVTTSIAGGADIVRVHDVPEMVQVAKMADAMYRVETNSVRSSSTAASSPPPINAKIGVESKTGQPRALPLSKTFYDVIEQSRQKAQSTLLDS